jgi:hypothetical protein
MAASISCFLSSSTYKGIVAKVNMKRSMNYELGI